MAMPRPLLLNFAKVVSFQCMAWLLRRLGYGGCHGCLLVDRTSGLPNFSTCTSKCHRPRPPNVQIIHLTGQ
ncbi:hypothetical protein COO60DRAFT_1512306 [Scenedesmus sp. NREL 46B-D3]|nr:hypothetical protein COO60DRAFT_1512306 [Scenedesmus sp. NREL 46B-D3]